MADADDRLEKWTLAARQSRPLVRIGLEPRQGVEISGDAFRVLDPRTGKTVWRERFGGALNVVAEGAPEGGVGVTYRVQVAALGSKAAAEAALAELERDLGVAGVVRHDPDRGNWRVRLGGSPDRLGLNRLIDRLRASGRSDYWIAEEPAAELGDVSLRLVDARYESFPSGLDRLAVVPEGRGRLSVDGKRYRGILELRVNPFGEVRAINWIGLEAYLLGVVPAELGPEVWPQLEALKAQAVAARTYVWRNRGQFGSEGFDLCATPRCQVYDGVDVEHPLSDRAVAATRGQVLAWGDEPIIALYTATCGGHTENGAAVFAEHDEPYLKGVPCYAENEALATLRATVSGRSIAPVRDETGADVTRDGALLEAAGVLTADLRGDALTRPLTSSALRALTTRLAALAGLAAPAGEAGPVSDLGQASETLLADLGWDERARLLIADEDLPALLRDDRATALPASQARSVAYLASVEGLTPFADGAFHVEQTPSASRLFAAMTRIGETYRAFDLRNGVVSGVGKSGIRLVRGKGEVRLPLATEPYLFSLAGGRPVPAERLEIWPGDRVRYRLNGGGAIDFMEITPPVKGASDDRSAAVYSWEVRRTRRELEASVNARLAVGRLVDLEVLQRGVSGRVAELRVVGTKGATVVRGFDVRRLLELRESLTVIEIQRDDAGQIEAVVFAGKGWGHGVGLCQVGAYGMALRGATYREILAHYYRGAKVRQVQQIGS